jgi:hypothetical protein
MDRVRVLRGGRFVDADREDHDVLGVVVSAVAGVALGLLAGLATSQFFSEVSPRHVSGAVKRIGRRSSSRDAKPSDTLERAVNGALDENPKTRQLNVRAHALSDGIVELVGTAPDRDARAVAGIVARGALDDAVIVNRILVEGEDVPRRPSAPRAG